MQKRYFVKFIGDKHVTLAVAKTAHDVHTLQSNHFEETTEAFFTWVKGQTQQVG